MSQDTLAKQLVAAGLSRSFAHHIVAGTRDVSIPTALWLHDECGITVPQLNTLNKRELDALRGMYAPRPPKTVLKRLAEAPHGVAA